MVLKRLVIAFINVLFPPLAILLICGPETDLIINCLLFLAAVIPSHVHAFYISCTYFNRKRKVRNGIYPGKWRWGIYSERVQNGGASSREILRLKRERAEGKKADTDHQDNEWNGARSKRRTRTSEYQPAMQQTPSQSS